jgi:YD repeat-containing protein
MNAEMFGFNNSESTFDFEDIANPLNPWERNLLGNQGMMSQLAVRSRQFQSQSEIDLPIVEAKEAILLNATAKIGINDFNLRTEGRVTFNGGGDLDGEPLNLSDDTHIYARRGFTFNNTPILPVQRDSAGNPIRDASGKQVLVEDAVDVSAGFTARATNNPYSNLIPPAVIPAENVIVPGYNDVRSQELAARIPVGTPTVTFNPQQKTIGTASQWNANFPPGGTSTVPTVVRIASGGLTIPDNVPLRNYVIIVESGTIAFNGTNHLLDNVVLVANNGNINLGLSQSSVTNFSLLASGNISFKTDSRFNGKTLLATGRGNITFGSSNTNADGLNDNLRIIAQGNVSFSGAAKLRGEILSTGTVTSSGQFDLFGSVGAKQDITFNGRATITNTKKLEVKASLVNDTAPNNSTNTDKITFDPSVKGTVTGSITEFKAGFDSTAVGNYVNILPSLTNGAFTLSRTEIDRIAGGTLSNGAHTLNLLAKDSSGSQTAIAFTFTLDNQAPSVTLDLAAGSDTPPVGDLRTTNSTVTLVGQTEAGASVQLLPSSVTTPNSTGAFQFDNVSLVNGANSLTVNATDIAGNVGTLSQTITRDSGSTLGQALDLSVKPGGYLEVPLSGVDANGNRVTYRLQSTGNLPTGELDGNGNLIFTPTPSEIGTYQFGLIASNDTQEIPQTVTLRVVADPVTTTRISGVIANTAKQPLAGVVVEIGGLQATTAADGSFEISANGALPSDTLKVRGEGLNGAETYPFIAEKLPLLLGREVFNGVDNIIGRPIYLPPLDMANAQTINPSADATVTTAAIPNASVFVKAGTLKDQSGNDFTGELGITEVPSAVTPAALPKNLIPDLVVTIQPGEMVFLQPAPLSLPNRAGYEAGSEMDLWSINPTTGDFDNVGRGRVSADGSRIETIEGGIRNSSWHFFAPQPLAPLPPDQNPNNPDDQCDECETTVPGASEIEMHSGAVRETHDLLSYQSLGETRGLSLNYNSMRADPRPIVHVAYSGGTNANQQLVAKVSVSRGGFTYQVPGVKSNEFGLSGGENIWRPTLNPDVALQADMREMSSGRYEYTMTSGALQFNNNAFAGATSDQKGEILLVNSSKSAFGSGWGLSGLQELVRNDDGSVLLIDGDGTDMLFRAPTATGGTKYVSPPGDFSILERLGDGTFRRTLKDRTVYQFDLNNRLVSMKDRHGNDTRYAYNSQGQLTQVTDPVGLATTLTYTNNRVTSITDPAGRVTRMEYNSSGDLTKITDPDGTSRTWEYDDKHHMTVEIDKRGGREEDVYDFAGRAVSAKRTDGTTVSVNPLQTQGLLQSSQTLNPNAAPFAAAAQNGVGNYIDSRGNRNFYILDRRGQIVRSGDAVGILPTTNRNVGTNLVTNTTDARGYTTTYDYDAQGNVVTMTGGDQSQRRYSFDSTFNQVTSETDELGRQTLYDIDPLTGDVRGMTQVVGAVGGDDDLVTRYTYTPQGLVDLVTDPLGRVTDYDYDAQGRQSKVTVAKGTPDEASQQSVYDAAGNQIATIDENGVRTEYEYDALNRVVKTTMAVGTPVQATQQVEYDADGNQIATIDENGKRTEYVYDAMGQLVQTTTPDPDDGGPLSASVMTSVYDAAGNQTATVDALGRRTQYRYDARNRLTETIHPDGSRETLSYDLGDNNIESMDALGRKTTREYDARGRLTRTRDPLSGSTQFEYDINNQLIVQIDANGNRTTYTYDELGRQVSVRDALGNSSSTQFDKVGNTIAETDELNRTTRFSFDNRDREIAVTSPLGLVNRTVYDKVGNVVQTIDPLNRAMRYVFDARNRQVEVFDPLNQKVSSTYYYNETFGSERLESLSSCAIRYLR